MSNNNVFKFAHPGMFTDSLTEILRNGARALLTQAVEAEVADFLDRHAGLRTEAGRQRVARHGHLPEREAGAGEPIRFNPAILPRLKRGATLSLEVLIPILYLKGISSGDFEEALHESFTEIT